MALRTYSEHVKDFLRHYLLKKAGIERIHIIGCARSGTTMLHYAMLAFRNIYAHDRETNIWSNPQTRVCYQLYKQNRNKDEQYFFVTKRASRWWQKPYIQELYRYSRRFRPWLIHLVRDPRDVMVSKHPLDKQQYYVSPELWKNSIEAAEWLWQKLEDYPYKMTLRYEDVAVNHNKVLQELFDWNGLELRAGIEDWSRLKDYVEILLKDRHMATYMHGLRNFNSKSIGKWKGKTDSQRHITNLLNDPLYGKTIRNHLKRYHYDM